MQMQMQMQKKESGQPCAETAVANDAEFEPAKADTTSGKLKV